MKIRNGFVSNSSSSSFILDKRNPKVKDLLPQIDSLPTMDGLSRDTGAEIGQDAVAYAKEWIQDMGSWYDDDYESFGKWILNWAKKIGENNIVLVRESDEGMGGDLEDVGLSLEIIKKYALDEREYH